MILLTNYLVVICIIIIKVDAQQETTIYQSGKKVCRNVVLMADAVSSAEKFQDCDIISGHLRIHLMDLQNFSMPNLTMVNEYVLLHRCTGIKSLDKVFPRLTVIRGTHLFHEHSLILVDNIDIQTFGPWNLNTIMRGAVHLESNVLLCFDYDSLSSIVTEKYRYKHAYVNNYPICRFGNCERAGYCETIPKSCSKESQGCPNHEGLICHTQCVGGCNKPNDPSSCVACKHFLLKNTCVKECPATHLMYLNYTCVTKEFCMTNKGYQYHLPQHDDSPTTKSECVEKCPEGFTLSPPLHKMLQYCTYPTTNVCPSTNITSRNHGQHLKSCKTINGNLDIDLPQSVNMSLLEENLRTLEIVSGYVRLVSASSLFSLNFLQNLRVIGGQNVVWSPHEPKGYSLYIMDNGNLKELWDWKVKKTNITINGKVFIRFNDMLCPQHIENLISHSGLKSEDVDQGANGRLRQCKIIVSPIQAEPASVNGSIDVSWKHIYRGVNYKAFLGYYIYYRKTDDMVTKYQGMDACNNNKMGNNKLWHRDIYENNNNLLNNTVIIQRIKGLQPNSRYAFYIQSFALGKEKNAVETNIAYATVSDTNPKKPGLPIIKNIKSKGIQVSWDSVDSVEFYEVTLRVINGSEHESSDCMVLSQPKGNKERLNSKVQHIYSNPYLKKIECNGEVDMEKMEAIRQLEVDIPTAISNLLVFYEDSSDPNDEDEENDSSGKRNDAFTIDMSQEKLNTTLKWNNDDIKYSRIQNNKYQRTNISVTKVELIKKNSVMVTWSEDFNEDHFVPTNKAFLVVASVRACRSRLESCQKYLNTNKPCALCSEPSYSEELIKQDEPGTIQPTFFSSKEHFSPFSHQCSNMTELRKSKAILKIQYLFDPMISSYKILYSNDKNLSQEICVSKEDSIELNHTCWLSVSSDDDHNVIINAIVNKKSYRLFNIKTLHPSDKINIWLISILMSIFVVILIAVGSGVYWRFKFKNSTFMVRDNPIFSGSHSVIRRNSLETNKFCDERSTLTAIEEESDDDQLHVYENCFKGVLTKEQIKRYKIMADGKLAKERHVIGRGEFGEVSMCKLNEREVAIKISRENNSRRRKEIIKEGLKVLSLDSKYIIKCLGIKFEDFEPMLTFEHIPGGTVENYLREENVSAKTKLKIGMDLSLALDYLGQKHIVHADVAARNILRGNNNFILSDFGFAKRLHFFHSNLSESINSELLENKEVWGTENRRIDGKFPVRHHPPEDHLNCSFDTWSFGIVLIELLTEKEPFSNIENKLEIRQVISNEDLLNNELQNIVANLLEESPLIEIMLQSLKINPSSRVTPNYIVEKLQSALEI